MTKSHFWDLLLQEHLYSCMESRALLYLFSHYLFLVARAHSANRQDRPEEGSSLTPMVQMNRRRIK